MIDDETKTKIRDAYKNRFGNSIISVDEGVENVFGGTIAIATYKATEDELIGDVVFIDTDKRPIIFASTQELVMFLRQRTKFQGFQAFIDSKMFHAIIFLLLIVLIFWEGVRGNSSGDLGKNALAILGSVVGLAAGLFFGSGRK